jgi:transcriptional regulator with XRE-family HTH domain
MLSLRDSESVAAKEATRKKDVPVKVSAEGMKKKPPESSLGTSPCRIERTVFSSEVSNMAIPFAGIVCREIREAKNISLRNFASIVEENPSKISRVETGEIAMKLDLLEKFANAFGEDLGEMLLRANDLYLAHLRDRYKHNKSILKAIEDINLEPDRRKRR